MVEPQHQGKECRKRYQDLRAELQALGSQAPLDNVAQLIRVGWGIEYHSSIIKDEGGRVWVGIQVQAPNPKPIMTETLFQPSFLLSQVQTYLVQ